MFFIVSLSLRGAHCGMWVLCLFNVVSNFFCPQVGTIPFSSLLFPPDGYLDISVQIIVPLLKGHILPKILKNMFFGVTNEGLNPNRHLRLGTIFRNRVRTFLSWAWYACVDRRNEGRSCARQYIKKRDEETRSRFEVREIGFR